MKSGPEMDSLIDDLERDEGFCGQPYQDTLGQATIGFGTLLPLTEEEGRALLMIRLEPIIEELRAKTGYGALPWPVQRAMVNMAYNLGVPRLQGFTKMWTHVEQENYTQAAYEAWNSTWRRQVGRGRSSRIVALILQGAGDGDWSEYAKAKIIGWEEREKEGDDE